MEYNYEGFKPGLLTTLRTPGITTYMTAASGFTRRTNKRRIHCATVLRAGFCLFALHNKLNGLAYSKMLYIAPLVVSAAREQTEPRRDLEKPATKYQRQHFQHQTNGEIHSQSLSLCDPKSISIIYLFVAKKT